MVDAKKFFSVFFCALAFVLFAVNCAGDAWATTKDKSLRFDKAGLWRWCKKDACAEYLDKALPDNINVLRALSILAVLASNMACLIAIFVLVSEKLKGFLSSILLIVGTLCMLVSLAIFVNYTKKSLGKNTSYGWSFNLGLIGCFAGIGGIILGF